MKFLVDAQLPRRLARWLDDAGFPSAHTFDLPKQNRTTDAEINRISLEEQRVVLTKDADFVDTFLINQMPWKLLLVSTGNIRNSDLEELIHANIGHINELFRAGASFIELTRHSVVVHS